MRTHLAQAKQRCCDVLATPEALVEPLTEVTQCLFDAVLTGDRAAAADAAAAVLTCAKPVD